MRPAPGRSPPGSWWCGSPSCCVGRWCRGWRPAPPRPRRRGPRPVSSSRPAHPDFQQQPGLRVAQKEGLDPSQPFRVGCGQIGAGAGLHWRYRFRLVDRHQDEGDMRVLVARRQRNEEARTAITDIGHIGPDLGILRRVAQPVYDLPDRPVGGGAWSPRWAGRDRCRIGCAGRFREELLRHLGQQGEAAEQPGRDRHNERHADPQQELQRRRYRPGRSGCRRRP